MFKILKKFGVNKKKGFTLIELVIVIAIIGVLAIVTVPKLRSIVDKANDKGVVVQFHGMSTNLLYFQQTKNRLPNLTEINETFKGDYDFVITKAIVKMETGQKWIGLRAESSQNSAYRKPYGVNFMMTYSGPKVDGDEFDIVADKSILENWDPKTIEMIIIDCKESNTPEIMFAN